MKALMALMTLPLLGLPAPEGGATFPLVSVAESPIQTRASLPSVLGRADAPPHDLHASYGNLGVDGTIAVLQLRIFQNDLEEALARFRGVEEVHMEVSPEVDALFLGYLTKKFVLEVDGEVLTGRIIGSGDDELDREPVWWYQIRFDAPTPIQSARVTNTVLFEIFNDQSNILRVVKFPEEDRSAYYFAAGEETIEVTFGS